MEKTGNEELGSKVSDYVSALKVIEEASNRLRDVRNPRDIYKRTAGEVEARNAERRNFLPPERCRELPPSWTESVPRRDQIVRFSVAFDEDGNYYPGPDKWGTAYTSMTGKGVDAVHFLQEKKGGWVPAAWHRDGIGDIDIVYGETNGNDADIEDEGGWGIAHIDKKHNVDWEEVEGIIQRGKILKQTPSRIVLVQNGGKAVIALDYFGDKQTWLVSAYGTSYGTKAEKKNPSSRISIDASGNRGATDRFGSEGLYNIGDVWPDVKPETEENAENEDGESRFSVSPVWTGSAADYEQPSLHYVGTGEGNQVYGWGLYGSSARGIGEGYARRDVLNKRREGVLPGSFFTFDGKEITPETDVDTLGLSEEEKPVMREMLAFTSKDYGYVQTHSLLDALHDKYFDEARKAFIRKHGLTYNDFVTYELWKDFPDYMRKFDIARNLISRFDYHLADDKGRRNLYNQTFWPDKEENLIDWFDRVSDDQLQQIADEAVKENVEPYRLAYTEDGKNHPNISGAGYFVYKQIVNVLGSPKAASEFLYRAGIDGITYIGGSSGVRNYVAFSDKDIRVDEHIRFSLSEYSEADQRDIVAFLRPKYRTAAFVEPLEVKSYLEENGFEVHDENDAWSFYQQAGMQIKAERNALLEEQRKRREKAREKWIGENYDLINKVSEFASTHGLLDFTIRPSLRHNDGDEWTGTFTRRNGGNAAS